MKLCEYQDEVKRTIGAPQEVQYGLVSELGELYNLLKKRDFHGHVVTREELIDEAGDLFWYIVAFISVNNLSLTEVVKHNITKLRRRYPNGFSIEDSINRQE